MPENITNDAQDDANGSAQVADQEQSTEEQQQDQAEDQQDQDVSDDATDEQDLSDDSDEDQDDSDDEDSDEDEGESDELKRALRKTRRTNRENKNLRERLAASDRELNQLKVALETGLPLEVAKRLQGKTVDEMKQDAETLLPLIGKTNPYIPGAFPDDGVRRGDVTGSRPEDVTDLSKVGARIYER